jgi:mRNA interferase HigB
MRILAKSTLRDFWEIHPNAEAGLKTWFSKIKKAEYLTPSDLIADFKGADYVGSRIVFNIAKNKFRLIASFRYDKQICFIHFVGTHSEYDEIDAKTVEVN